MGDRCPVATARGYVVAVGHRPVLRDREARQVGIHGGRLQVFPGEGGQEALGVAPHPRARRAIVNRLPAHQHAEPGEELGQAESRMRLRPGWQLGSR